MRNDVPHKETLRRRITVTLYLKEHPEISWEIRWGRGQLICSYIDEGVIGTGMGAFPVLGPLAEDSATKLKRGHINVCTV